MTPRSIALWRTRLRTLKRDLVRALGDEKAKPLCRTVDTIAERVAEGLLRAEEPPVIIQEVPIRQLTAAYKPFAHKGTS